MRYVVVYNPVAGQGRATKVTVQVQALLESKGHAVEARASERAGHIAQMGAELAKEMATQPAPAGRLLVLGGDGSLREAAAGLLGAGVSDASLPELGILPFGTGNVVARELGLPLEPLKAASAIEASASVPFDVGWATPDGGAAEPFLAMIGAGFDASITRRIGAARNTRIGGAIYRRSAGLLYGVSGLAELASLRPARFSVVAGDDEITSSACAAVLSNTETYGRGMSVSPGASPSDGVLDLFVRTSATPWAGVASLVSAQLRREGPGWVAARARATRATLLAASSSGNFPWQLDGDPMPPAARVEVSVAPGALRLVGDLR
ncbi:MAG: diacylglycerol kinase family protein [Planctomycetota bacterium]